jgi:hypothetical protein
MNNQIGQPKKAAKRTQLKFRFSSLTANDRLRAKKYKRLTIVILAMLAMIPPGPAAFPFMLIATIILRKRHQLLTNYLPLLHQPILRTNITRNNFPVQFAWTRLRFKKIHLGPLMLAFGIDDNMRIILPNRSSRRMTT